MSETDFSSPYKDKAKTIKYEHHSFTIIRSRIEYKPLLYTSCMEVLETKNCFNQAIVNDNSLPFHMGHEVDRLLKAKVFCCYLSLIISDVRSDTHT